MILPTKHIPEEQTLLGVGGVLLSQMSEPRTVSSLWQIVRRHPALGTFDRYVLGLVMLHILGVVDIAQDGLLVRTDK